MDAPEDVTSGTFIHLRRMAVPANTHKTSMPSMVVCSDRSTVPIDDLMTVLGAYAEHYRNKIQHVQGKL